MLFSLSLRCLFPTHGTEIWILYTVINYWQSQKDARKFGHGVGEEDSLQITLINKNYLKFGSKTER